MAGSEYWLTVLAETSRLESGIKAGVERASREATVSPKFDTRGASKAGQQAGRDIASGVEAETGKSGGLGRMFRTDGARQAGQQAGNEINAGLASANVGRDLNANISSNMGDGQSIGRRFGSAIATGLKGAAIVGGGLAVAGIAGAMKSGFGRLTAIDDATFKLRGLGHEASAVDGIMKNALASVKGTAFGLDEAATTAATAVAAGIEPGEKLTEYLKLAADTAAVAGSELGEMGYIFNKVQTSGKAFTNDLNMLADRGLPIFTWLQEEYGVTGEELSKMVADGKVDAETFRKVVAENIGGAALEMGGSVRGSLKNLRASYSRFGAELSGPLFAGLKPLAIGLTAVFDDLTTAIKPIMADLTATIGPWATDLAARMSAWAKDGGISSIIERFTSLGDTVKELTSGGGSATMSSLSEGAKGLGEAAKAAAPALQSVGTALGAFGQAIIDAGPDTIRAIMVPAMNALATGLRFLADNASWAVPTLIALGGAFVLMRTVGNTLGPIFSMWTASANLIRTPLVMAQTAAIRQQAAAMTQLSASLGTNTVAQNMNTAATNAGAASTIRGRIAALGHAIATRAQAVATRAAAAGQWLLNAALTANPIGLIIAAVVAIGVALWAFFTKTEVGRKLWSKAWNAIKSTTMVVVAALNTAFQAVGKVISWLWHNIAVPAFQGIGAVIATWWAGAKIVWDATVDAVQWVGDKISWLWQTIAVPAFEAIGAAVSTWWAGVKRIWDMFTDAVGKIGDKVTAFKDGFVNAFKAVRDIVLEVWDRIGGVFDKISGGLSTVGNFVKGAGSVIVNTLGIGGNAAGGLISGPGTGTSDSILARLSDGEYVINAAATRRYLPLLEAINGGGLARFAGGGLAQGKAAEGGLQGNSILLARLLSRMFPQIASIGGYRADGGGYTDHPEGRALDIMIPNYSSEQGIALGNAITAFLMQNADKLNVDYTIWRQTYRSASGASNVMGSRGSDTADHFDHVHVTTKAGSPADYSVPAGLKLPGGLTSSMDGQGIGGGLGSSLGADGSLMTYRAATDAELSASGRKVESTANAVTQTQQRIDDLTYDVGKAQRRIDELAAAGKPTADAEEALRRKERELADANDKLAKVRRDAAEAEAADEELRTKGKLTKAKSGSVDGVAGSAGGPGGMDGSDFGQMFVSGLLESVGLDGSLFSNPLEWPTVKSAMAGVNFLGGLLSGGNGSAPGGFAAGAADSVGLGGMLSAIPGVDSVLDAQSGSPALTAGQFNPAVAGGTAASTAGSMSAFAPHQGGGQTPGPAVDNSINFNGNVGMAPTDIRNELRAEQMGRTRTTVRRG